MQAEVKTDVGLLSIQDLVETETPLERVGEDSVKDKDTGSTAFTTRVFLVGSGMAIRAARKQPFIC